MEPTYDVLTVELRGIEGITRNPNRLALDAASPALGSVALMPGAPPTAAALEPQEVAPPQSDEDALDEGDRAFHGRNPCCDEDHPDPEPAGGSRARESCPRQPRREGDVESDLDLEEPRGGPMIYPLTPLSPKDAIQPMSGTNVVDFLKARAQAISGTTIGVAAAAGSSRAPVTMAPGS